MKMMRHQKSLKCRFRNYRLFFTGTLMLIGMLLAVSLVVSEDGADTFNLGAIPAVIAAKEGELLQFSLEAPAGFGPNVRWTISSPDISSQELTRIFSEIPAFPGAEGFGINTRGGRGGRVIKVTNLNTSGPGSFTEALLAQGPRTIVFDVSGVIEGPPPQGAWLIAKSKRFYTANDPLTIAGQTAPGAGITLFGQLVFRNGDGGAPVDNVIARFLRIRDSYHRRGVGDNMDGPGNMAVFDHISGAWGVDENFDFSGLKNASIQWCGIEESAGYGDEWEVLIDKDNDGMMDYWEQMVCDYDSSDTIKDYILHVLPDGDLDHDGFANIQEYSLGSNPLVPGTSVDLVWIPGYDSDKDGMFDWWEQKAINSKATDALNTLADINPGDDLDGDLSTNLEEHNVGTTPLQGPSHNYGMIMGYGGKNVSLHHNFFAHHHTRTPLSGTEIMDHRNNVIYNIAEGLVWHPPTMNEQRPGGLFKANIIGNFFKVGPNSLKLQKGAYEFPFIAGSSSSVAYGEGNYFDMIDSPAGYLDIFNPGRLRISSLNIQNRREDIYKVPYVKTHSGEEAYRIVLAHAGAWPRDAVTLRNITEIKTRTGKWGKKFPSGGLLQGLSPAPPDKDSDNDGMPDDWETEVIRINGGNFDRGQILNRTRQDNNKIVQSGESVLTYNGQPVSGTVDRYKGYTYLEYYLNELADRYVLKGLLDQGLDASYLPGFGSIPKPNFLWVPGYDQSGEYRIQITASDGTSSFSQDFRIQVSETNRDPFVYPSFYKEDGSLVNTHQINDIEPGRGLSFKFFVCDPDGQNLSVQIVGAPERAVTRDTGTTTNSLKGIADYRVFTFDWHPTLADVGWSGTISISAKDSSGGVYVQDIRVKVRPPSNPVHVLSIETSYGGTTSLGKGQVLVQDGDSRNIYFYPEDNYKLEMLAIDSASLGSVGKYFFSNITTDHSIKAVFAGDPGSVGGCILDLRFDASLRDSSIYGNHGVANAGRDPIPAADRFGSANSAYEFNGTSNYIVIPDDDIFDEPAYTIIAWVKPRKNLYSSQHILSKSAKDGSDGLGLYAVYDSIYTCGAGYPHSAAVLRDRENQWIHIAVSRKSTGAVTFYYNGEVAGESRTNPNNANSLELVIGARNGVGSFFQGIIDELKVYNKALNGAQIKSNYLSNKTDSTVRPMPPSVLRIVTVE